MSDAAPAGWEVPHEAGPLGLEGETVAAAFVERALRRPREVAVVDDLVGVLTAERLLVAARLLARRLRALPGAHVGVLLPASAGCDIALLATHLAGKVPVLLNWTTGPANLAHACRLLALDRVVTSQRFLDRAELTLPDGVAVYPLETLRTDVGVLEKLLALLAVRWLPGRVRAAVPATDPGAPAAILFTSGSERAPKAVPLTHGNVLSCIRGSVEALGIDRGDVILSFLPPFHSFGLTVGTLMPLLGGMRVVHHPDPTDARRLVDKIARFGVTLTCATPTFLRFLLRRARGEQLASLGLVAVGAEACPAAVFELFDERAPGGVIVEGYGVTECAPVVAVNPRDAPRRGTIGRAIPGVELVVVDPADPSVALPAGEMGLLLVRGPTVFPGYLGEAPDPFVEHAGQRWYSTGDLVHLDADGYVHFRGRIKRFLKVAGEMVSLPAIEGVLAERWPAGDGGPCLAVEGVETERGRRIVCYTTRDDLDVEAANAAMGEAGMAKVMRVDAVERLEAIPLLGTGKTDYKSLRARLLASLD